MDNELHYINNFERFLLSNSPSVDGVVLVVLDTSTSSSSMIDNVRYVEVCNE